MNNKKLLLKLVICQFGIDNLKIKYKVYRHYHSAIANTYKILKRKNLNHLISIVYILHIFIVETVSQWLLYLTFKRERGAY